MRKEDGKPEKRVPEVEVNGIREIGRPKFSKKDMVEKESSEVGLNEEDAQD